MAAGRVDGMKQEAMEEGNALVRRLAVWRSPGADSGASVGEDAMESHTRQPAGGWCCCQHSRLVQPSRWLGARRSVWDCGQLLAAGAAGI